MTRAFSPKVLTANDLMAGDAIYRTGKGTWSRRHGDAQLFLSDAEARDALRVAQTQTDRIVGPYLADARPGPNGPEPIHFREAFRTRGPSNYTHGKQETLHDV